MKILQLIDTLNPGGAERMALNYYRALKKEPIKSFLVITREKGQWGEEIIGEPDVYFLKKRSTFDIGALLRFKKIINKNEIEIVHAHGTSWFFAVLCKLSGSRFKLIWHDHYGNSQFLEKRPFKLLKLLSFFFDGIICVNKELEKWAIEKIRFKKEVIFLPNFIKEYNSKENKKLKGSKDYKLICIANLRPQKDHLNLLKAFDIIHHKHSVSLHIFGRDFKDKYSEKLKLEFKKRNEVYYYGEVHTVQTFLEDADIGILSSKSEGLPIALLEYGNAGLAVVCTKVGDCERVLNDNAKLVTSGNSLVLARAIESYLQDSFTMKKDGESLRKRINKLYSEKAVLNKYLSFIKRIERL